MAGLFKIHQCISCGRATRIPWLRMWIYIPERDQLYCSEHCIWNYGRVLHRRRLIALRDMAQFIVDDATQQMAALNNIVAESQTTIVELAQLQQQVQTITEQLKKVDHDSYH